MTTFVLEDAGVTRLGHHLLLCELHAHTTWSDGSQTIGQLVDTYGQAGFDVLCITDHAVRPDDPFARSGEQGRRTSTPATTTPTSRRSRSRPRARVCSTTCSSCRASS